MVQEETLMSFKVTVDSQHIQQSVKNSVMLSNNPSEDGTKFHSILNNEAEVKLSHNLKSKEGQFSQLTMISVILILVHLINRPICHHKRD